MKKLSAKQNTEVPVIMGGPARPGLWPWRVYF